MRIDGQGFAQHIFHAEVCDCPERRTRMGRLKPSWGSIFLVHFRQEFFYPLVKCGTRKSIQFLL